MESRRARPDRRPHFRPGWILGILLAAWISMGCLVLPVEEQVVNWASDPGPEHAFVGRWHPLPETGRPRAANLEPVVVFPRGGDIRIWLTAELQAIDGIYEGDRLVIRLRNMRDDREIRVEISRQQDPDRALMVWSLGDRTWQEPLRRMRPEELLLERAQLWAADRVEEAVDWLAERF